MRHRWRNIVALLLTLVFAPSSVLAAMPVVWCIGADGHQAVEASVGPSASHVDHRALGDHRTAGHDDTRSLEHGPCQDRQLLDKSKICVPANDGVIAFGLRDFVVLPSLPLDPIHGAAPRYGLEAASAPPDALLVARRSVVLLI